MLSNTLTIAEAACALTAGKVVAYPTESVYGLGCDPWKEESVQQLLDLKHRSVTKGLILIAADWRHITPLIKPLPPHQLDTVKNSWPGPVTWVFPASDLVPLWIRGAHETVAIRLTAHTTAYELAKLFDQPIVSTSANIDGYAPARDITSLLETFGDNTPPIVQGELGSLHEPTTIRDACTHEILRPHPDT